MPTITLTPSGQFILTYAGELVVCESKTQVEEWLDWFDNRQK